MQNENGDFQCLICLKNFGSQHALKTHKGMIHKNKFEQKQRRKMQMLKAAKKYNTSVKGKKRAKKYEESLKAFKRRQRYRHSTRGKQTQQNYKDLKKKQRKEEERRRIELREIMRQRERKREEQEFTKLWEDMLRKGPMDHYINGEGERVCLYPDHCLDKECPNSNRDNRAAQ